MVRTSGAMTNAITLPTQTGEEHYDSKLRATITKEPGGGYQVADQSGETEDALAFNASGKVTELRTPGPAKVNYEYEAGRLSEIAVEDPATFSADPEELNAWVGASGEASGPPTFISAFGSAGSGPGQLSGPRGITADGKGHVWVIDAANNRVEEFKESGEYIGQFGSAGTGNGQFSEPWGIAVTPAGNLWVVDTGNKRIEEFNSEGKFIQKFGTKASGSSKGTEFVTPEGIAIAPGGMIWVSDTGGGRIAEFRESVSSESERFVRNVATTGTGNPGLSAPMGLAVDASGNLWATDQTPKRILEYSSEGAFLKSFGKAGSGEGQLETPKGLAVGPEGDLYVVDRGNERVEVFNPQGEFLDQFGTSGSGNGNFSEPRAIAIGAEGEIFVSDKGNNRVHRWEPPAEASHEIEVTDGDPAVSVETANGLITEVNGAAAGENTYKHEGQLLTAYNGPQGEAHYEYDSAERLKKVTLPNGTWGEVVYFADGRVKSVAVSIEGGAAKTTRFEYTDTPSRSTLVIPPEAPQVTYDIDEDGSVFKSQNALEPPTIDALTGTLGDEKHREKDGGAGSGSPEPRNPGLLAIWHRLDQGRRQQHRPRRRSDLSGRRNPSGMQRTSCRRVGDGNPEFPAGPPLHRSDRHRPPSPDHERKVLGRHSASPTSTGAGSPCRTDVRRHEEVPRRIRS